MHFEATSFALLPRRLPRLVALGATLSVCWIFSLVTEETAYQDHIDRLKTREEENPIDNELESLVETTHISKVLQHAVYLPVVHCPVQVHFKPDLLDNIVIEDSWSDSVRRDGEELLGLLLIEAKLEEAVLEDHFVHVEVEACLLVHIGIDGVPLELGNLFESVALLELIWLIYPSILIDNNELFLEELFQLFIAFAS